MALDLEQTIRELCAAYSYGLRGVFQKRGEHDWPLVAANEDELVEKLASGGHLLPLPKEPAALANVLEVSVVDFLMDGLRQVDGVTAQRGTERGYPDLEVSGAALDDGYWAVDIKVAQRKKTKRGVSKNTQSRITLYTGNTYFRYPTLHWPGTFRPFADYAGHLDVVLIYVLDEASPSRVTNLELIVREPWRIASKQRSSTTREYIGAVLNVDDLREGRGEFDSAEDFYHFWRHTYRGFKIGAAVQQQLDKLLAQAAGSGR